MIETPFRGVFYRMAKGFPTTKIEKLVNVSLSSFYKGRGDPYIAIDPRRSYTGATWLSTSEENSSYCVTFLRDNLTIKAYSIKSRTDKSTYNQPLEWILEGSNDLVSWDLLHHKERGEEMRQKGAIGKWFVNSRKSYKSFKITQLGVNSYAEYVDRFVFGFNKLELYGKLDIELAKITCIDGRSRMKIECFIFVSLSLTYK